MVWLTHILPFKHLSKEALLFSITLRTCFPLSFDSFSGTQGPYLCKSDFTFNTSNRTINRLACHAKLLKNVDGVELSFCFIFLVKTHNNLTALYIFEVLHCHLNDTRLLPASITSYINSMANLP